MFVDCAKMVYGMTTMNVRKEAYELAEKNDIHVPETWKINKCVELVFFNNLEVTRK